jgi:hypothetical protein
MKLRTARVLAICGTMVLLACVPGTAGARSAAGRHCVFGLVPESRPKPHVISARLERVGCFDTFSEAIEAGSGGAIRLQRRHPHRNRMDRYAIHPVEPRILGRQRLPGRYLGSSLRGGHLER